MPKLTRHAALAALAMALAVMGVACHDARMTRGSVRPGTFTLAPRGENSANTGQAATHRAIAREALAEKIRGRLLSDGGCTLDPRTGQPIGPINAYAVSREGFELRLAETPTTHQIATYLERHETALANEPVYIGAWRDDRTGAYYLDLSELVTHRAAAEARGREQGQRCIYHLATGSEIRLR